jgi:Na+/H+-dicarboxylate symporter
MIGKMFVNALKIPVVPLVIFSLICGVTGIGDIRVLGHLGGRSLVLYIVTTGLAISIAILLALVIGPGVDRLMDMIGTAVNITRDAGVMDDDDPDRDKTAERDLARYARPH